MSESAGRTLDLSEKRIYNFFMKIDIPDAKIGVAVSGGVDSMVLLRLFMEGGGDFCVLNVEHGIRGESSVRDSEFVAKFCKQHGIECYSERVNALEYAEKQKMSVELAARELRYGVFEKALNSGLVEKVALAHHADDNAETVLMRIFRGTGVRGLKGISERGAFIRPLLGYTREEIAAYAEKNGVPYVEDETNADVAYTRNFIRNELMPLIKERYPQITDSLLRLSKNAEEIDEYLEKNVIKPQKTEGGKVLRGLYAADDVIKKYSINAVLRSMGAVRDVERVHLTALLALQHSRNNASAVLPFGITAVKYDDDLYFFADDEEEFLPRPFVATEKYRFGGAEYAFLPGDRMIPHRTFDGDKAQGCVVRTRRDGDRFHRVNGKSKLLSDYCNERKLLNRQKDRLLVLAKGETVFAILGVEVAEEAKIDKNTKNIVLITKENDDL